MRAPVRAVFLIGVQNQSLELKPHASLLRTTALFDDFYGSG